MKEKILKSKTLLTMFLVLTLSFANVTPANAATIKLNKKSISINKNATYQLKISGTKSKVTWSTTNKNVATVTSKGKVTGKSKGTCTIKAKVNKKTYTCKVTVKVNKKAVKKATSKKVKKAVNSSTVYITATGHKYHRGNCGYLSRSKYSISLKDAKARGYTACSRCY